MSKLRRIDVKAGFQCNNRCRFCVQGDKRHEFADHSTEAVKALLTAGRRDADEVVLTGGEITIRDDLPELVRHARDLGFVVIQLQTNGRMLSHRPFVEALQAAGVTELSPAIHGPTAAIHDGLTRSPGSFRQTVKGVRQVRRLGLKVIVNSVIVKANVPHLPALARLLVALEVDQFQLAFVHALGSAAESFATIVPRLTEVRPQVIRALNIGLRAGVRCMTEAIPLCFLPGLEDLAAEAIIPRTKIFDADQVINDYTEFRRSEGKAKGPMCQRCIHDTQCEGPWREYPEHFGWEEFEPVTQRDEG
jgi:MoaA/NifB/PqqE/SkfB family radical SAM enzyme